MKLYNIIILLILSVTIVSCNSEASSKSKLVEQKTNESIAAEPIAELEEAPKYRDTIKIDYVKHKALLTILKLLPESTMGSWKWLKKDREKTVDFIEQNNFIIDSTKMYNNIKYIKPNTIGIQVVDGFWTLSIYDFGDNDYFIVTNDSVGDGNDIQTFNFLNNELKPTKMINWFSGFKYKFLLNTDSTNCLAYLEDNDLTYDYDFSDKNTVTISSWLFNKEESENCLKGNAIKYKLNREHRTFDISYIYWKNDTTEYQSTLKFEELHRKIESIGQNVENLKFKIALKEFNLFLNLHLENESNVLTVKNKDIVTDFNFTYDTDLESALEQIKILKSSSENDIIVMLPVTTEEFLTFQLLLFESQQNTLREGFFEINTHEISNIRNFYLENTIELIQLDDSFEITLGHFKYKGKFTEYKK